MHSIGWDGCMCDNFSNPAMWRPHAVLRGFIFCWSRRDQEEGGELDSHKEVRHFCQSRRDQEEGGELDSHEEVRHFCQSRRDQEEGGELDSRDEVRHFCRSRQDQEEGGELDPQVSPEEIKSREVELGSERWTSFASVATQQQCYGHCLCDSAPHSSWDSNCTVHQLLHNGDGTLPQHSGCSGGGPRSPRSSRSARMV